jgi:hypothetical protein
LPAASPSSASSIRPPLTRAASAMETFPVSLNRPYHVLATGPRFSLSENRNPCYGVYSQPFPMLHDEPALRHSRRKRSRSSAERARPLARRVV